MNCTFWCNFSSKFIQFSLFFWCIKLWEAFPLFRRKDSNLLSPVLRENKTATRFTFSMRANPPQTDEIQLVFFSLNLLSPSKYINTSVLFALARPQELINLVRISHIQKLHVGFSTPFITKFRYIEITHSLKLSD